MDGRKRDKNAQRRGQSARSQNSNSYEADFQTKRVQNDNNGDFLLDLAATQAQLQAQEVFNPYMTLQPTLPTLPDLSENELMNVLGLQQSRNQ